MAVIASEVKALFLLGLLALTTLALEVVVGRGLAGVGNNAGGRTIFNVMDFGAKADGKTDNFSPFAKAWRAACNSNGPAAKVLIPPGKYMAGQVIFAGPCKNPAPVIEIQGNIIAKTDLSEFSTPEWLSFDTISGLTLTGGGTLDGRGPSVWRYDDCSGNAQCSMLPANVKFESMSNSVIHDITSVDSKGFHFHISDSTNITVYSVNIKAPGESPNTDGIHLSSSSFVNFTSLNIGTGDDCISLGGGTKSVTISDIICGPGHGISVGSLGKYENEGDVNGIYVNHCQLTSTTNGLRIKTWAGSQPSQASNIHFEDIILNQVKNPIIIDQHYGSKQSKDPSKVKISDVSFKNVTGSSVSTLAVSLMCSSAVPCEGVELTDVDLTFSGEEEKKNLFSSACENVKVVYGGPQNPPPCKMN